MKNLVRTAAILSGVLGLSGAAAALAVGCGGDDTVVGYGPDSGPDTSTLDSASDTSVTDGGSDAFTFDAGPPDLAKFYLQITETGCAWLENCCGGAADFDMNSCLATFSPENGGFLYTSPVQDPIDGGGNATLDQTKANQCLSLITGLSCTDPFSATQMRAIRDACTGAVEGNIPAGSTGCRATIECQAPAHCDIADDSGVGTCVAPLVTGSPCVLPGDDDLQALSRCGRGYTGQPEYCEIGDSLTVLEAGTCATPEANGTSCLSPFECQSWLCDLNNTGACADTAQIIVPGDAGTCTAFALAPGDGG